MCPVCYYEKMPYAAKEYNICPCCGTEFENDDEDYTHAELRQQWIDNGARWFFRQPPFLWNPWQQLNDAGQPLPYKTVITYLNAVEPSAMYQTYTYGSPIVAGASIFANQDMKIGNVTNVLPTSAVIDLEEDYPVLIQGDPAREPTFAKAA